MLQDLSRSVSLHRVHVEHPQDQVLGGRGDGVPVASSERDLPLTDPRQDVLRRVLGTRRKGGGAGME